MMGEIMQFPETVEEFMQQYKIADTQQVYTNGTELVPIFRMKQWFEAHKQRWIPCSERMPDMPGDYLVCTKNEYYGTKNVSKRYFNGGCWSGRWTNITHWMPLPEPPEEGDDGNGLD